MAQSHGSTNTLTEVMPKLLAQGLMALRSACVMPSLVNRDYDSMAAQRGDTVNIPIPSAIAVNDVATANVAKDAAGVQPTNAPVALDKWKEAPFYLTDKDLREVQDGTIPMQASSAVKALAEAVNADILDNYKSIYNRYSSGSTNPFKASLSGDSTTTSVNQVARILDESLCPRNDRRFVVSPDAHASALDIRAFQDISWRGNPAGIQSGMVNELLGFQWHMDQQVPNHSPGLTSAAVAQDDAAVGDTELDYDTPAGGTEFSEGDIFTVAGDTQTYVVKSATNAKVTFSPGLKEAPADNAVITVASQGRVNLAFHRDAIAFVTRPLEEGIMSGGNEIMSRVDPESGLALRLEVSREHKRTRFSYDILYGTAVIRPELACRLNG